MRYVSLSLFILLTVSSVIVSAIAQEKPESSTDTSNGPYITRVVVTKEEWSGDGKAFNQAFFVVESGKPPAGYELYKQSFTLIGDRHCNFGDGDNAGVITPQGATGAILPPTPGAGYCEIRLYERSAQNVRWGFRMQGHDENSRLVITDISLNNGLNVKCRRDGTKATSRGVLTVIYKKADGGK